MLDCIKIRLYYLLIAYDLGGNITFMPWLRNLVDEIYLAEVSTYYSFNSKNTIGYNFTYFHWDYYYYNGQYWIKANFKPFQYFHQLTYSHSLNEKVALGLGFKYIKSKWGDNTDAFKPLHTVALDIGGYYNTSLDLSANSILKINIGSAITNFGPRAYYPSKTAFIPTKLCIGTLFNPDFYLTDQLRLNLEIAYQADKYFSTNTPYL